MTGRLLNDCAAACKDVMTISATSIFFIGLTLGKSNITVIPFIRAILMIEGRGSVLLVIAPFFNVISKATMYAKECT